MQRSGAGDDTSSRLLTALRGPAEAAVVDEHRAQRAHVELFLPCLGRHRTERLDHVPHTVHVVVRVPVAR